MEALNAKIANLRKVFWISLFAVATVNVASPQAGNGGISGVIADPAGGVVPGATVILKSEATGVELSRKFVELGVCPLLLGSPAQKGPAVPRRVNLQSTSQVKHG